MTEKSAASSAIAAPAVEGPVKEAIEEFKAGRQAKAVELATPLAEKGNPDALYLLGFAHESGQGAEASRDKALGFYRKAAELKQKDAIYRLAAILLASEDKTERSEAQKLLEVTAAEDPTVANRLLGEAYLRGKFSEKPDTDKAIAAWKAAGEAGDSPSWMLIGRFYEGEFGFPEKKSLKEAINAYTKAAELGNGDSMVILGSRLLSGDKEIRNEQEGLKWLKKAIDAKAYSAYLVLGDYQESTKKDLKAALAEYERGKDVDQIDCTIRAANFYLEGKGTEKDEGRGLSLLEKAAEAGSPVAHLQLAVKSFSGEKPELLRGYSHLLAASTGGLAEAQSELGLLYLSGKLGAADGPAGSAWLTRAAKAGFAPAQYNLGTLFERGLAGLDQSYSNAATLYALSATQGHGPATYSLARLITSGAAGKADPVKGWALATLSGERGVQEGKTLAGQIAAKFQGDQMIQAKKELENIKSGKATPPPAATDKPAPPKKP